jgi:ribosome modulation factor
LSTIMHGRSHRLMTSTMVKYIQEWCGGWRGDVQCCWLIHA